MLMQRALQLTAVVAVMLWATRTEAGTTAAVKLCGRKLSEIMSRVCDVYNSPWSDPSVEHSGPVVRRKRQLLGIADECCDYGCTWEQLNEYCAVSAHSEPTIESKEEHMISDRSAELENRRREPTTTTIVAPAPPTGVGREVFREQRLEVGPRRRDGYGRARTKGRRCSCRRRRRSGRRRPSLMGNTKIMKNVVRAAPVVGTVSPIFMWGRTLNTELPIHERERYAYVVYS